MLQVISTLVPMVLKFYRKPILSPPKPMKQPQVPSTLSAANILDASVLKIEAEQAPDPIAIHGSVSTADIVNSIRAIMAEDEDGSRVVLGPENVNFIKKEGQNEDMDRVKRLGEFEIEVKVKGVTTGVKRVVKVLAEDPNSTKSA